MQKKLPSLFAGTALIVAGALALVDSLGFGGALLAGDRIPPLVWAVVFAGLSVLALVAYLISGVNQWGWLFPTGIFGGLAVTLGLTAAGVRSSAIGAPLFAGLTVPFVAAWLLDRTQRWWALIPAGVMAALTLLLLAVEHVSGEWVGAGVLFMVAGAFLVAFLARPQRKWAALVAYILAVVGCMPLLASAERAPLAGVVMLAAIGLPFLGIYLFSPARWWAIIPAGLLLTASMIVALVELLRWEPSQMQGNALMLAGCSLTFAVIWLRHKKGWAGVAAAVLAAVAVGVVLFQGAAQIYGPALLVAVGLFLLYRALRPHAA